ncbi:MAG: MFS transporter [Gammaproteobacteria bacterium]|nr:MFS transporter [Gammaproteobacteria bacterium]MDH3857392.1 MFS transporter [Gammaproteobacteria bacterium]
MNTPRSANTRNLVAACAAITVFGFAFGMTYPLLSLILESRGIGSDMIGINSAMMPIGILLFSSMIPVAAKHLGARKVAITAAIVTALLILSYKVFDTLAAWFLIRLLQGMSISTLFVLSEAWIVGSASDQNRGKVVAIYASVLSGSFGAGPLLISFIGIEGWTPFILGAAVVAVGVIPFIFIREDYHAEPEETHASGILGFAPRAPMLLAAVGTFAVFDAASLSLFPVYGIQNGLDLATSANILTALILGNVLLQFPIGWLCDRFPHRFVMAGCALITAISLVLLPATIDSLLKWPLLVLMGTTGYGVYTVSLAALGNRFSGIDLVNGSASFALVWGFGALIGSVSGGWAMLGFGPHGLPISLALIYLLLAGGVGWRQVSLQQVK